MNCPICNQTLNEMKHWTINVRLCVEATLKGHTFNDVHGVKGYACVNTHQIFFDPNRQFSDAGMLAMLSPSPDVLDKLAEERADVQALDDRWSQSLVNRHK